MTDREKVIDGDLISRQAAIDALHQQFADGFEEDRWWNSAHVLFALEGVPSAQPEIIRCKDCKHFEYDHPYIIQGIPVLGHEVCNAWGGGCKTDENGYCFMAERRTDGSD